MIGIIIINFIVKDYNILPKIPREYIIPVSIISLIIGTIIGNKIKVK